MGAKRIMYVEGVDGQVELMADRVIIHRQGIWNVFKYGLGAKREIPLGAISEISYREPTRVSFGSIDFVRSGRSAEERKQGSNSAVKFKRDKMDQFEALKEKAFELMQQQARQRQ